MNSEHNTPGSRTIRHETILMAAWLMAMGGRSAQGSQAWADSRWEYRQQITIGSNLADSTLTNFPVLVQITNQSNTVFSQARADGRDILFTDATGTNKFAHEIERYTNGIPKELDAWVKIPALPPAGTVLYMYYGNPSAANQQDVANVWESNYKGVWHLNEAVTNGQTQYDSTANANNATRQDVNNSGGAGVQGQIDGADIFDGTDDYLIVPNSDSLNIYGTTNPVTLTAWANFGDQPAQGALIVGKLGYPYEYAFFNNGVPGFEFRLNDQGALSSPTAYGAGFTNWHFWAGVYDGATLKLYRDGAGVATNAHSGVVNQCAGELRIGAYAVGNSMLDGRIDEVRVANTARSADWIKAEYRIAATNASYLSFAAEESSPSVVAAWHNDEWDYRQRIVVGGLTDSELTNFPVLIQITNQNNAVFSKAQADGDDILFTDSTGTKYAHEIEKYTNTATRELDVWVKMPLLSQDGAVLYMYYGNPSAANQQDVANVWESNYKGVWHLNEAVGNNGTHADSTANGNDGTRFDGNGSGGAGVPGQIAGCDAFDALDDYVRVADDTSLDIHGTANLVTLSVWANFGSNPTQDATIVQRGGYPYEYTFWADNTPKFRFRLNDNGSENEVQATGSGFTNWHHWVGVYDSTDLRIYRDGELAATPVAHSGVANHYGGYLYIGAYGPTLYEFGGWIDEVRLANTAYSADWVLAEYRTAYSPAAYQTFDAEEDRPPKGTMILLR